MMLPKDERLVIPKITEAAEGEACTNCGIQDGTVVAAHSNWQEDGKGVGKKAHDLFVAFLCGKCHWWLDFSKAPKEEKREMFHRAMKRTWLRLWQRGIIQCP
jgi:ribosomal protein S27AE